MNINNERNLTDTRESRYTYLTELIREHKCKTILETGTWKGKNSIKMIQESLKHSDKKDVRYYGFDVWEQMTKTLFEKEYSKWPPQKNVVSSLLSETGIEVNLVQGNTIKTLPKFVAGFEDSLDFVYIDGGHSFETIENDWNNISTITNDNTIIVFDDYYVMNDKSNPVNGCSKLINEIINSNMWNVEILPGYEQEKTWDKKIYFVKVTKRIRD
jgi:predicted O-methyltransferase YrrM